MAKSDNRIIKLPVCGLLGFGYHSSLTLVIIIQLFLNNSFRNALFYLWLDF